MTTAGQGLLDFARIHQQVRDPEAAHLVIGLNKVVTSRVVPGLKVEVNEREDGAQVAMVVEEGARIRRPVHLCFGALQEAGVQKIVLSLDVQAGARVDVVAHCIFPNAVDMQHLMDADIRVGPGAHYTYAEQHIHSEQGGITVAPKARVLLEEGAEFRTEFVLLQGCAGVVDIDYHARCEAHSVLEMMARISGRAEDRIRLQETAELVGEYARGVLKSRVAVRDRARADVTNTLKAMAAHARGHVDCQEILKDEGVATAVPIVEVHHPQAHVTHEAALGSVDTRQLQTLMARGMTEEQASELIIQGLLS